MTIISPVKKQVDNLVVSNGEVWNNGQIYSNTLRVVEGFISCILEPSVKVFFI